MDSGAGTANPLTDWGFACLIEGTEKTLLFDTGGTAATVFANMATMRLQLAPVDHVVISHDHGDHLSALSPMLKANNRVTVWLPYSSSTGTKEVVLHSGTLIY